MPAQKDQEKLNKAALREKPMLGAVIDEIKAENNKEPESFRRIKKTLRYYYGEWCRWSEKND